MRGLLVSLRIAVVGVAAGLAIPLGGVAQDVSPNPDLTLLQTAGERALADYLEDYRRETPAEGVYLSPEIIGGGNSERFPRWERRLISGVAESMGATVSASQIECVKSPVPCRLVGGARVVFSFGQPEVDGDRARILIYRMVQVDDPRASGSYADLFIYNMKRDDAGWRVSLVRSAAPFAPRDPEKSPRPSGSA